MSEREGEVKTALSGTVGGGGTVVGEPPPSCERLQSVCLCTSG